MAEERGGLIELGSERLEAFSAAVFAGSAQAGLARRLIEALASAEAAAAFKAAGLEPLGGREE